MIRSVNKNHIFFMKGILALTAAFFMLSGCISMTHSDGMQPTESVLNRAFVESDPNIAKMLEKVRKKHAVPAMAAAVITSKGLQNVASAGIRKWGTEVPVTLEDLWHLGSDTKIMTATLAAILIEKDKLKWTTTVSEVFPELVDSFYPDMRNVSLLQLLSHRAGLPANLHYEKLAKYGTVQQQRIEAVKEALAQKPLSKPGSAYLYSNLGYIIAGAMIERVTGESWEDALKKNIFTPLGMESAGFGGLGTPGQIDQPWGHESRKKPYYTNGPSADNLPVLGPAGTVHCSIQDWSKFIQDQLLGARGENALLKPQSYEMLQSTHFGGDYALGWVVVDRDWAGGKALTHTGSNTLFLALAWVAPGKDLAILVCTNMGLDSSGAADEVVGNIIKMVLKN